MIIEDEIKKFNKLKGKTIKRVLVGEFGKIFLVTEEEVFIIDHEKDYGLTCDIGKLPEEEK